MLSNTAIRICLAGAATAALTFPCAADSIRLDNAPPSPRAVLIDGSIGGSHVNDRAFLGPDGGRFFLAAYPLVRLDDIALSPATNEVVAFASGRPPTLGENVGWTAGEDLQSLTFADPLHLPFTVWILHGPFDEQRQRASNARALTATIWRDERQGIAFGEFEIVDATSQPGASALARFDCSQALSMKSQIGFEPGRVNIYYVNTVDFGNGPSTTSGVWCGSGLIAMGSRTFSDLLSHEIGHAFGLAHTNVNPGFFDTTNVMHNASIDRRYLTEGQTFRAVFDGGSAVNAIYAARPGRPLRGCAHSTDTNDDRCLPIQKRIWRDGSWGPN